MVTKYPPRCRGVYAAVILFALSAIGVWAGETNTDSSKPIATPMPAFCFAPGTSQEVVQRTFEQAVGAFERHSLAQPTILKFEIARRWTATATDGPGLSQGDPTTLTWSVVPDGTSISGGIGEPAAPSNLRSFLNGIYGNQSTWLAVFQQVFDRWGELTGITYVYESSDDGAQISYSYPGQVGVRGDIRIGGHTIDGNYGVLAYNYYPNSGDMVIDTADSFYSNTSTNSIRMRNVVAHEHGHGIGLDHACPVNNQKLMEPYVSTSYDGPQHDDILATNRTYGDRFEHDDTPATAASLGSFGSTTEVNLSVDSNSDTDVYSFIVDAGAAVDVSLTPIGSNYLSGPQNPNGSCTSGTSYNSLTIQDLEMRVLDVNGTNPLAAADINGVGQSEALNDVDLWSGAGTYFVEISGDSTDEAQLYQLSLTISSSTHIFADGFQSGTTTAWGGITP